MTELVRAMRLPVATSTAVGTIIGVATFVQPSAITRAVPSMTGMVYCLGFALGAAGQPPPRRPVR